MNIEIENSTLDGVKVIKPQVFKDSRGLFMEMYRKDIYEESGLNLKIEQVDGMNFNIFKDEWSISKDTSINYIAKSLKI